MRGHDHKTNAGVIPYDSLAPLLAMAFLCLTGCADKSASSEDLPDYAFGKELSEVDGVSIVRVQPSSGQGYHGSSTDIEAHGIDLLSFLAIVSEGLGPIVLKEDLPGGRYDISAKVEEGGRRELTRKVSRAFSEAFDRQVGFRTIEIDAFVMTCPDRESLSLESAEKEEGFWEHEELEGNARRTFFSATVDNISWAAGYMTRSLARQNDLPDREARLETVFVNETGIEGVLKGALESDPTDPERVRSSLRDLGFELTLVKREVPALVVEAKAGGEGT